MELTGAAAVLFVSVKLPPLSMEDMEQSDGGGVWIATDDEIRLIGGSR